MANDTPRPTIRAIETRYAGHLFRSRLEARWAAFFDLMQWQWTYEPFDANGWIPDFILHGELPVVVEVKPAARLVDLEQYAAKIDRAFPLPEPVRYEELDGIVGDITMTPPSPDVLIVGLTPSWTTSRSPYSTDHVLGLVRDGVWGFTGWENAIWHTCLSCLRKSFHPETGYYGSRPTCGCHSGDDYLGVRSIGTSKGTIESAWGAAAEKVRWRPR